MNSRTCNICGDPATKSKRGHCRKHWKLFLHKEAEKKNDKLLKIGKSVLVRRADGTKKWISRETTILASTQKKINQLTELMLTPVEDKGAIDDA